MNRFIERCRDLFSELDGLDEQLRIDAINEIRESLAEHSPLKDHPVDCVLWVQADRVQANDYNPNTVAPPEMELLRLSVEADGYTQPIVVFQESGNETVIDGFHRNRVGRECEAVVASCKGRLPVARIRPNREERNNRIASTIRHNRARGKHGIEEMSKIVVELTRRNWSDKKIAKELGMEPDEVLRLKQVTGLAEMFKDREFSEAWEAAK